MTSIRMHRSKPIDLNSIASSRLITIYPQIRIQSAGSQNFSVQNVEPKKINNHLLEANLQIPRPSISETEIKPCLKAGLM